MISAAVSRTCPTGDVAGVDERIPAPTALDRCLAPLDDPSGTARRVRVGAPADLVLLDRPLVDALAAPTAEMVRATVIAGRVVHHA